MVFLDTQHYHKTMANFYKQNGSYFTTTGQKVANPTELQSLAKAGGREVSIPTAPAGSTKISGPSGLQGLNESQLFRQGQDIYKLPTINPTLSVETTSPDVPVPEENNDIASYMAGLDIGNKGTQSQLEMINKQSAGEKEISEIRRRQDELTEQAVTTKQKALPTAEQFGLTENTTKLQSIMPQIASLKAQFDNAEIAQEGKIGSASSIYGRQALIQRQRAVELAGLSAVAQAYQGNIELAQSTAKNMVDMELAPIQTQIDNQKWQLEQVKDQLTIDESRKAESLNLVLNERQRLLDEEKEKKNNIANLAITAAQNGADQSTIEKIMKAGDYMTAIKLSSQFLTEGNWTESEITDANGNPLLYNENTGEYKTGVGTSTSDIFFTDANGDSWNIAGWATDQTKPQQMNAIAKRIGKVTEENIDEKVKEFTPGLTADMIKEASAQSGVSWEAIMTMVVQEAQGGTSNVAKANNNFGGLTFNNQEWIKPFNGTKGTARPSAEGGNYIKFATKQDGLNAMAALMAQYGKVEKGTEEPVVNSAQNWADMIVSGRAELSNVPTDERTDVVNALVLTPGVKDTTDELVAKQKAQMALSLQNHNGLNNAVGTIKLGRYAPFQWGQKQDFIAGVEQLVSGLSLEALIEAKSRGATFGALSDTEMRILASAATKIGTWTMRDSTGRVTGYKARESDMRAELQNIANILTRGLKDTTINQLDNNIITSTPIMTGQTSSGMGYQVIE